MKKLKILKSYKDITAGEVVDGTLLNDGVVKVFHRTGWYVLPEEYCEQIKKGANNSLIKAGNITVHADDIVGVQDIDGGVWVITKNTRWDFEAGDWENPLYIPWKYVEKFLHDWEMKKRER